MPQNSTYNYGNPINEIEKKDTIYLQLDNTSENHDSRIDSDNKYLVSFADLLETITSNAYITGKYTELNFNINVDDIDKILSYQDKKNILKTILKNTTPCLDFDLINLTSNPIGLTDNDNKLYLMSFKTCKL